MEKILTKFKGIGFKLTTQRLAILKFLDNNTGHPTAEDIYREIKKTLPTVSFATVYNTIQALQERGQIAEVTIDPIKKHFDPNVKPHHHIMCSYCRRVEDVFVDYSDALKLPAEMAGGFKVTGNHVDFYGICRDCEKAGR